ELRALLRPPPRRSTAPRRAGRNAGRRLVEWVASRSTNVNDAVYWAAKKAAAEGMLDAIEDELVAAADHAARAAGKWTSTGERQTRKTIGSARSWVARHGGAA